MKPKRALVTGATGFIGAHLCRRLEEARWNVHFIVRGESRNARSGHSIPGTALRHDGTTEGMNRLVANARPDVVFHLASLFLAEHRSSDVEPLCRSNILLGMQLLDAMAEHKVPYFVNTGTGWQHYQNADYNPVNLYAATKQAFEDITTYYVDARGISAITLQIFDTYGPEDPRPKIWKSLRDATSPLPMSPGRQKIDLVHVYDIIEAYLIAAKRLIAGRVRGHEIYALSSGKPVTLKQLVSLYSKVIGKQVRVIWGGRSYRNREVMTPWQKGRRLPGWRLKVRLEQGFRTLKNS
jgi:nucleoside-diphosphate-sugar epimerase